MLCVALQPEIQGVSGRSKVAVMLQEEVVLSYGTNGTQKQHYLVRQYMFHEGVGSSGGHFTVAVREQQGGKYKEGDKWRYLDSAQPAQSLSLDQMVYGFPTKVYAALLVAKTQPQDDPRPMLVAPPAPRYTHTPPCHWCCCRLCLITHHFFSLLDCALNLSNLPFLFQVLLPKAKLVAGPVHCMHVFMSVLG